MTIVDATPQDGDLEDVVRIWRMAYPEVDVRWRIARGSSDSAVLAESAAAALTVLGPVRRRRINGSKLDNVLRLARGPVVMVGA